MKNSSKGEWIEADQSFINPYNFISLEDQCERYNIKEELKNNKLLTGYIECKLIPKTPIFIPNTTNNKIFNEYKIEKTDCEYIFYKKYLASIKKIIPSFTIKPLKDGKAFIEIKQDVSKEEIEQILKLIPNKNENFGKDMDRIKEQIDQKTSYDFYSYTDLSIEENKKKVFREPFEPVIPASEIRGVIRTAYEVVTNSCLSTVDVKKDNYPFYKRTSLPGKPGILRFNTKENQWEIIKAERYMLKTKPCSKDPNRMVDISDYREGEKVYFIKEDRYPSKERDKHSTKKGNLNYTKNKGNKMPFMIKVICKDDQEKKESMEKKYGEEAIIGYIHKGEDFTKKHHESIFVPKETVISNIDEDAVKRLEKNVQLYQDNTVNLNNANAYSEFKINKEATLIYYREGNPGAYYLSPACISREVFKNNNLTILKQQGNYQPCDNDEVLCMGCSLFGMVGERSARSSRIRFTDAIVEEKVKDYRGYYEKRKVLHELSSPKTSATEFYLERPKFPADLWNYDYAGIWENNVLKIYSNNVSEQENYKPKIRGRKYYWHAKKLNWFSDLNKHNNRNVIVRPLSAKRNISFKFNIYFEGITEKELQLLIWTLNIGSNENENCHKIGMGKPLGLGSVKIKVMQVYQRLLKVNENGIEYQIQPMEINEEQIDKVIDRDRDTIKEFLKISDFSQAPDRISYPIGKDETGRKSENSEGTHQWFIGNKGNSPFKPKINKTLPKILDDNISLNAFKRVKK